MFFSKSIVLCEVHISINWVETKISVVGMLGHDTTPCCAHLMQFPSTSCNILLFSLSLNQGARGGLYLMFIDKTFLQVEAFTTSPFQLGVVNFVNYIYM
jgi:hypothetical protein